MESWAWHFLGHCKGQAQQNRLWLVPPSRHICPEDVSSHSTGMGRNNPALPLHRVCPAGSGAHSKFPGLT